MLSPFSGMNPYLEQDDVWHDFHRWFVALIANLLVAQVRPKYIVNIAELVYVHEISKVPRRLLGGVNVGPRGIDELRSEQFLPGLLAPPFHVRLSALDRENANVIEIRDRHNRELVCVIELLSPANKRTGPDRNQYLAKREQLLGSRAHFVEIDLLRGGKPMPLERRPTCDYSVLVSRVEERPQAGLWPVLLRDRLPIIPIPLRQPDPQAQLDLQEALHRLYDAAGYEDYIYGGLPDPPLNPDDAAWARQLITTNQP